MKNQIFNGITLFCILHFTFCIHSNAQIVYTDVNPDSSFYFSGCPTYPCPIPCDVCVPHYIDLNNDGTNDFHSLISNTGSSGSCMGFPSVSFANGIYLYTEDSNSIATQNGNFVSQFNSGDTISSQNSWITGFTYLQHHDHYGCINNSLGIWSGSGYAGLKLKAGNQEYYGWAKIYAQAGYYSSPTSYILYEYAYNTIPNQFILAGDTGTVMAGIIHVSASLNDVSIFPNPFLTSTIITLTSLLRIEKTTLKIYDVTGREVKQFEIRNQSTEINRENLSSGIYFYIVQNKNEIIGTGKLVIQ